MTIEDIDDILARYLKPDNELKSGGRDLRDNLIRYVDKWHKQVEEFREATMREK